MASLVSHCCKLLCTRSLPSSIIHHYPVLSSVSTRYLQLWPATRQEEDKKDFDENRDAVLGDFSNYDLSKETVRLLKRQGVNYLFEVQYKTYKEVREGIDVFVQARTGTGKTLGYALPIIEAVQAAGPMRTKTFPKPPQVLALAPTRELAIQIAQEFEKFVAKTTNVSCFYGGVSMSPQNSALYRGVDILVGTPGRILDHLQNGRLNLSTTRHVILDEADRMLDMGFQRDIEDIFSHAYTKENKPQTLLFSATLPPWVRNISRRYTSDNMQQFDLITSTVKSAILVDHKSVQCAPYQYPDIVNHFVEKYCDKEGKALVFTQTKREAENLAHYLKDADYITGDKSQNQRERTLEGFKRGWFKTLVATDVASRGLDIPKIDFVLQTSPPKDVDAYIHRSGRTGRAGTKGLSIVLHDRTQFRDITLVEKHAGIKFTDVEDDPKLESILGTSPGNDGSGFSRSVPRNYQGGSRDFGGGYNRRSSRDFGGVYNHRSSRDSDGEYNRRSSKDFGGEYNRSSSRDFGGEYNRRSSRDFSGEYNRRSSRDFGGEYNRRSSSDLSGEYDRRSSRDFDDNSHGRPSRDRFDRKPSREGTFNHRRSGSFEGKGRERERDSDIEDLLDKLD